VDEILMSPAPVSTLFKIFVSALAIRWGYDFVLYWTMGNDGFFGVDSQYYLQHSKTFADALAAGSVRGIQWLGTEPMVMPLPTWLISLHFLLFGPNTPLAFVLCQGVFDAGTCVIIFRLAQAVDARYALPSGVAACINPTQIVLAGFVYTDSLFVFFVALFLLGAVQWLRQPRWSSAIMLGIGLGVAALTRVVVAPFIPAVVLFLIACAIVVQRENLRQQIAQMLMAGVVAGLCVGSISVRNEVQHGSWSLTPETGYHVFGWVVPLVQEAEDGTPWQRTYDRLAERRRALYPQGGTGTFDESEQFMAIAKEEMAKLHVASFVKAWAFGAVINLSSPAIILSPPIQTIPRAGFYDTTGKTLFEKVWNFLFHSAGAIYSCALYLGVLGVAVIRLVQLRGAVAISMETRNIAIGLLFLGWIVFILLVNGPIASPKYRLPIEPVLMTLTGAGWWALRQKMAKRRA
jgi:4-amino-4-deoxy-L-arabinose transferase-like glycosyltransferase